MFLRNLKEIMKNFSEWVEQIYENREILKKIAEKMRGNIEKFQANSRNLQKFWKNYEIPDLSELWTDFTDMVKKNPENSE